MCPPFQYKPDKDVLNAAQSGAMIPNLVTHEWRYMLEQLKEVSYTAWKYFGEAIDLVSPAQRD